MTNTTQAPRPVAAVDTEAARRLTNDARAGLPWARSVSLLCDTVDDLADTLDITRAELDAALTELDASGAEWTHWQRKAEAAEAERDAALAALARIWDVLPGIAELNSGAQTAYSYGDNIAGGLLKRIAEIRASQATAPAPVPAADAPDVPAFLAHRVNGGAM